MYKIVFSIPVHEKPEVIFDSLINYLTFNPDCAIVLHIAQNFNYTDSIFDEDSFMLKLKEFDNVYVNEEHVRTGYGDIIQAHISNFDFIKEKLQFEYFVLGASNDLFIKSGLYDFIKKWNACLRMIPVDRDVTWIAAYKAKKDECLKKMIKSLNGDFSKIYRSQVEGAAFTKQLFTKMGDCIKKYYDYKKTDMKKMYAREEVYFSSIIWLLTDKKCVYKNNCTFNAEASPTWTIYREDIDRILINKSPYFCVKRVDRNLNNPIRAYIRTKIGGYQETVKEIAPNAEKFSLYKLNKFENMMKKEDKKKGLILKLKNVAKHIKPIRDFIGNNKKKA